MANEKPIHFAPYRAGSKERGFEKTEIRKKVLSEVVIERALTGSAALILFAAKKDGHIHFCVDYGK